MPFIVHHEATYQALYKKGLSLHLQQLLPFTSRINTLTIKDLKNNQFEAHVSIKSNVNKFLSGKFYSKFFLLLEKNTSFKKDIYGHRNYSIAKAR